MITASVNALTECRPRVALQLHQNALISARCVLAVNLYADSVAPMCRLTERTVRSTLVTAWFLAGWPTSTSPLRERQLMVVLEPGVGDFIFYRRTFQSRDDEQVLRMIPTARATGILLNM